MLKSSHDRFGTIPAVFHWVSAVLIFVALATGLMATSQVGQTTRLTLLWIHIPVTLTVLTLTLARLVWWMFFDTHPPIPEGCSKGLERSVTVLHVSIYAMILVILASGIWNVLSGGVPVIYGPENALLPAPPGVSLLTVHGWSALILGVLLVLHIGGILSETFLARSGLLWRMWIWRHPAKPDAAEPAVPRPQPGAVP